MTLRFEQPVIGYRVWVVEQHELCALDGEPWTPGDVTARCRIGREHAAPETDCACGLYGLHRPPLKVSDGCVLGVFVAWGSLAVHPEGFRAEHARPLALARTAGLDPALLTRLADHYSVPLVDVDLLGAVGQEFGATVPVQGQLVDRALLLSHLAGAITRRERCLPALPMLGLGSDEFGHRTLAQLARAPHVPELEPLLRDAWRGEDHPGLLAPVAGAVARLRETVTTELVGGRALPEEVTQLLRALDAAHGDVRRTVEGLIERQGADAVPDEYILDPAIAPSVLPCARQRARRVLSRSGEILSLNGDKALLVLEPDLGVQELEQVVPRMASPSHLDRLLNQAGERGPRIAVAALRWSTGYGAIVAARHLGRGARPLLLRQLRRSPSAFSLRRDPFIDALLGEQTLRLAAEDGAKRASNATDLLQALALLPGDEARPALHRLVGRVNALRPSAEDNLRTRTWNVLCSREHLARLLDGSVVRRALADESLGTTNHVLLLRAHPDGDPAKAARLWEHADLMPRFAVDVLRAAGPHQGHLVREAFDRVEEAKHSNGVAARLSAAIAIAGEVHVLRGDLLGEVAADLDQPATVRAVAAWTTQVDPSTDDPVSVRYRQWQRTRANDVNDPLIDLLSGAWLEQTIL